MDKLHQQVAALSCFSNPQNISFLGGGLTNVNVLVHDSEGKFVVRLGADIPEHGILRWNELALSRSASAAGFSPAVVHAEPGVLVLEFLEAKTFSEDDVCNPDNLPRIVDLMSKVHREMGVHLKQSALAFWPYHVNRTYIARLLYEGSVYRTALPGLLEKNNILESATGQIDIVIGHNDLLAANFLDDGNRLWLIDWEYGGFNSPLFDLAGLASNNGLAEKQEIGMLKQYFDTDADSQWRAYSALKCASLMRETLWSMTSEIFSDLDIDYAKYTAENMDKLKLAFADFAQV